MEILMFLILLGLTLLVYFAYGKDLLTPGFFCCLMFLGCYCILLLNCKNWQVDINGKFILYVTTAILSFLFAAALVTLCYKKNRIRKRVVKQLPLSEMSDDSIIKKKYPANPLIVVSLVCCVGYVLKLISDVGFAGSFSDTLRLIYENIVNESYSPGFIFNQMLEILKAIAYLNTFRLFIRFFSPKDKISVFKLLLPIVFLGIAIVISTDRNILIRYAIYFIVLWCFFFRENCLKKNVNRRIVFVAIICVAVFAVIFFIFGKAKNYSSGFFKMISIYAGSGLNCFNIWLESFNGPFLFGEYTFLTIHNSIGGLIGLEPYDLSRFDAVISYTTSNGYVFSSNVYTGLFTYVYDFGYFGVILFPFIIGLIFQIIYEKAKKQKYGYCWLLYAMLIYSVFFMPISEQFFRRWHLGYIYELFWVAFLYYLIFRKNKKSIFSIEFKVKIKRKVKQNEK